VDECKPLTNGLRLILRSHEGPDARDGRPGLASIQARPSVSSLVAQCLLTRCPVSPHSLLIVCQHTFTFSSSIPPLNSNQIQ